MKCRDCYHCFGDKCELFPRLIIKLGDFWVQCKYKKERLDEKTLNLRKMSETSSLYSRKCGY
jgi:hypothetical protein